MTSKTSNTKAAGPEHLSTEQTFVDQHQYKQPNESLAVETGVFGAGFTSFSPNTHNNHPNDMGGVSEQGPTISRNWSNSDFNIGVRPNFSNFSGPYSTSGVDETLRTNGVNHQQRYQPAPFFSNQYAITDFVSHNCMLYQSSTEVVELTKVFLEKELALYETFINELNIKTNAANCFVDTETLLRNKRGMVEAFMRSYWREEFLTNEAGLTFFLNHNSNTLKKEFKEALVTSLNSFKNKDVLKMRLVVSGLLVTISKNPSGSFDVCIL